MPETNARIKVCHDTAANFKTNNPTLLVGEWALETDTKKMKIGDGVTAYNDLQYSTAEESEEWQKPSDWIDIRSGALDNSIYFLVGHSAPTESEGVYTVVTYPTFPIVPTISNSGTYDVYVDCIKIATTNSATATTIDWGALYTAGTITSGYDVTHPSSLVTHIVRITPTISTNTITAIKQPNVSSNIDYGVLWVHFTISNAINVGGLLGSHQNKYYANRLCEAVTSTTGELRCLTSLDGTFRFAESLKTIPVIDLVDNNDIVSAYRGFQHCDSLNKVVIKNDTVNNQQVFANSNIKEIITENAKVQIAQRTFEKSKFLKRLPTLSFSEQAYLAFSEVYGLENMVLDASSASSLKNLQITGTSSHPATGVKGLILSNEAPFDDPTSPQINVSYTGMNKQALVNLFKSMPYNVGYEVVGSPTISDGVVSGITKNNYTKISMAFNPGSNPFELGIKFLLTSVGYSNLFYTAVFEAYTGTNGKVTFNIRTANGLIKLVSGVFNTNVWLEYRVVFTGTKYQLYLGDTLQTEIERSDIKNTSNEMIQFGRANNQSPNFPGSIDFNETYIKINDVSWFTGKEAMTKTCSIVGCTGTADLTTADKAIAEDKGWELVLA